MTTELETRPYRNFKELLDKIIKMPEDLQKNLTDAFEKRRIEMQNAPKGPSFLQVVSEKVKELSEKTSENVQEVSEDVSQEVSQEVSQDVSQEVSQEVPKEKSLFDSVFSGTQGSSLLEKVAQTPEQPPQLSMSIAPQHKCVIRGW
jgi:hypothetical protein